MHCSICNSPTHLFVDEKTDIQYYHCDVCEYIFKSPKYYQDFSTQKERYNLHTNTPENKGYQAYFQRFLDFVLPLVGNPKQALDFGCGESTLLASMLSKQGVACDYYDPIYHPHTLDRQRRYNLIVSTEVFEHLHKPKEVFEALLMHLEPQGYLAIQTQFHPNSLKGFKQWYYHQDPTHIVFFTPHTFKKLCEIYGCSYIEDNGTNMVVIQKGL